MRNWELKTGDPGSYILAADARTGPTDYTNDHIWELQLEGGEPPAVALQTTFGLRARKLRLFPRFVEGDTAITDPAQFEKPPVIHKVFPNYIALGCSPLPGIEVEIEYWVPESQIITGRVQISNTRLTPRNLEFEWAAILSPTEGGQRMAGLTVDAVTVLCGQTGGIFPVLFLTGGPEVSAGPYPALSVKLEMPAGSVRRFTWAQAARSDCQESFELARKTVSRPWDAETARIEVLNSGLLEIETGDPNWNIAFALAQKKALGLLLGPSENIPNPTFVVCRQPDQGYSPKGDGTDYGPLWSGQTPLETSYLSTFLLPASPGLARGLLFNFLETQTQQGFVDFQPGLAGQRSNLLATPLLTNLAWRIYQYTEDQDFLREVFPKLVNFVQSWFTSQQDRDGDGLPEWSRVVQSGFEDHPTFAQGQPWAQGGDITKVESPSLCAMLYREANVLIEMARLLSLSGPVSALEAFADNLKCAIDAAWYEEDAAYRNWDRETHFSPAGEVLGETQGPGELHLDRDFRQPVRLLVRVECAAEVPHGIKFFIHGIGAGGNHRIERLESEAFRWRLNLGNACTDRAYKHIEFIQVSGISEQDRISLQVMDLSRLDHTLLLPLWARIPDQEKAARLIRETILNPARFWQPFGISACPVVETPENHPCIGVHLPWNHFVGEGLIAYGYRKEAAELVTHLMAGVVQNLVHQKAFYRQYHAENGSGIGERHALSGLAPLGLFLETLGVKIISATKVSIAGENPFPWPVTVRYRELTVVREALRTKITFPGGQSTIITGADPRIITLENNH